MVTCQHRILIFLSNLYSAIYLHLNHFPVESDNSLSYLMAGFANFKYVENILIFLLTTFKNLLQ